MTARDDLAGAVVALDELTRRLRSECPWDRQQNARSIVPHTVEEAYELADAAHRDDDAKLLDELGDVLFQVHFLALLLEERDAGDLATVAEHVHAKLVRRHPHVFAGAEVTGATEVLRNWDQIKRGEPGREPGLFGEVPDTLPALMQARKVQRRAGRDGEGSSLDEALSEVQSLVRQPPDHGLPPDQHAFERVGDALFRLVELATVLNVDPELALRAASQRFRERVEAARIAREENGLPQEGHRT